MTAQRLAESESKIAALQTSKSLSLFFIYGKRSLSPERRPHHRTVSTGSFYYHKQSSAAAATKEWRDKFIYFSRKRNILNESLMSFTAVTELQSELFDAKAGVEVISHAK